MCLLKQPCDVCQTCISEVFYQPPTPSSTSQKTETIEALSALKQLMLSGCHMDSSLKLFLLCLLFKKQLTVQKSVCVSVLNRPEQRKLD